MNPVARTKLFAVAVLILCWPSAWGVADQAAPADAPAEDVRFEQRLDAQVPLDLAFQDENGREVTLGELIDDRPVILNLVYFRCPMLCNLAADGLIKSLQNLEFNPGREFDVITVSFDPREGPQLAAEAKKTTVRRYGRSQAEDHWHFLTGETASIERLADSVGFRYRYDAERGQFAHAAGLVVLTPQGRVSRYLFGIEYPPRDLRLSLVEAGNHEIGSLADEVLLLCYQYDPMTGKYGLLIQNVLRIAGVLTVGVLGCSVGVMLVRERHKRRQEAMAHDQAAPLDAARS